MRVSFEKYHGFISALLTVLAAALGILAVYLNDIRAEAEEDLDGLSGQVAALTQQLETRGQTIDTLEETTRELRAVTEQQVDELEIRSLEIEQLRAQIAGISPEDGVPDTITAEEYHRGIVTLVAGGDIIDFNAAPSDLTWSEGNMVDTVQLRDDGSILLDNISTHRIGAQDPTYQTCRISTAYVDAWNTPSLTPAINETFCARGSEGRYGLITMLSNDKVQLIIEIVTWKT